MSIPGKAARRIPLTQPNSNKYKLGKAPAQAGRNIAFAIFGIGFTAGLVWSVIEIITKK